MLKLNQQTTKQVESPIQVMLDRYRYLKKPIGTEVCEIRSRLEPCAFTVEEFATRISEGCSYGPSMFEGEKFVGQWILPLDFDNVPTSPYEHLEECVKNGLMPTIVHPTWSHSETRNSFRSIFILDEPIVEVEMLLAAQTFLRELFPLACRSSKDFNRIFYGSNHPVEHLDPTTLVTLHV